MLFLPKPLRIARILWHMIPFLRCRLKCLFDHRIKVELLDALSSPSAEEPSVPPDLLCSCWRSASFWKNGPEKNWLKSCPLYVPECRSDRQRIQDSEVLVLISQILRNIAIVRTGGVIPVEGTVLEAKVTVNQSSLTSGSLPVPKHFGSTVYVGTVVIEGKYVLEVEQASGKSQYDQIIHMIERSLQLKFTAESSVVTLTDILGRIPLPGAF
jgi:hypothetical protein